MNRTVFALYLLGGFELSREGIPVDLPWSSQRLLGLLALQERALPRQFVAASLWPDTTDAKASANLRTALWRLHQPEFDLIDASNGQLTLRPSVWVDVRSVREAARELRRVAGAGARRPAPRRARRADAWLLGRVAGVRARAAAPGDRAALRGILRGVPGRRRPRPAPCSTRSPPSNVIRCGSRRTCGCCVPISSPATAATRCATPAATSPRSMPSSASVRHRSSTSCCGQPGRVSHRRDG